MGEIIVGAPKADLALTKTDSPDPVVAGAELTYTITVTNNGPDAANAVVVTDNLPAPVMFVAYSVSGGGVVSNSGNNVTVNFSSLASGASATITLVARVNCSVANGSVISNTATVIAATSDSNSGNNSATATTTITNPSAISPASQTFQWGGGNGSFSVTAPSGCAWTASTADPWITITPPASGSGSGTVNYSVAAYTGTTARTGTITINGLIGGLVHTVTQNPPGTCPNDLLNETFSGGIPATWTVINGGSGGGTAATWTTTNPGNRTIGAPFAGPFAIIDSDRASVGATQDEQLITPTVNASGASQVVLEFSNQFFRFSNEIADVDVSTNGGATWTTVLRMQGADNGYPNPNFKSLDITSAIAANPANGKVRFHYYNAAFELWWAIDNVRIRCGGSDCPVVSISNTLTAPQGSSLTVPVMASDLTGRGILSYDFTLMFDPAVLSLQNPPFEKTGTLSSALTVTWNTAGAGKLVISAFGTAPSSGAGTLLNLKFNAGPTLSCSDLMWTNFTFNAGSPCATTSNGRVCVIPATFDISGTVSYCIAPTKKVPGVVVKTNHTPPIMSTTDNMGNYLLTGVPSGPVTVTPMKTGNVNGITSFDASLVAQYVVGLRTCNGCERSAGDANNDGVLLSFDAALIAQFAVGIANPLSIAGTWKFVPPNRFYPSVTGNLTGQNYDAVLVGDVSGNWVAPPLIIPLGTAQVPISLSNLSGAPGASVTVPITVGNLTGLGFTSYDFDLTFNQNVLQLQNPPIDAAGTLSSGLTITPNPNVPGRLRISAFGINALAGAGTLLNLKFNVVGAPGASTALTWQSFVFNEEMQTNLTNGSFTVSGSRLVYYPLPFPVRLLDTRPGPAFPSCVPSSDPLTGGGVLTLPVVGNCNGLTIPASAQAVVGNATVVNFQSSGGFITLYPSGAPLPNASNLNFRANHIVANSFTVGLGIDGAFNIFTSAPTHFIIDITGYYAPPGAGGLYFHPLPFPVRMLDTRPDPFTSCFDSSTPLVGGDTLTLPVVGDCNTLTIPASAKALVGNATVVNFQSSGGFITLFPSDAMLPNASNLNFTASHIVPNSFVVGLSASGSFKIFASASTNFIVDIAGYFSDQAVDVNGQGLLFYPLSAPARWLDTRPDPFVSCIPSSTPLAAGSISTLQAQLTCEGQTVPAGAKSVLGNATVVNFQSAGGFITLFPSDAAQPNASNLNFTASHIVPNSFVVGLGGGGAFKIFTSAATHFIVDLSGYFAP